MSGGQDIEMAQLPSVGRMQSTAGADAHRLLAADVRVPEGDV